MKNNVDFTLSVFRNSLKSFSVTSFIVLHEILMFSVLSKITSASKYEHICLPCVMTNFLKANMMCFQILMSVLEKSTTVALMLYATIPRDRTTVHVGLDTQEMEKFAKVEINSWLLVSKMSSQFDSYYVLYFVLIVIFREFDVQRSSQQKTVSSR